MRIEFFQLVETSLARVFFVLALRDFRASVEEA